MSKAPTAPCPVCAADLDVLSAQHCTSPTCTWKRCLCGALVSQKGLWIEPAEGGMAEGGMAEGGQTA